MRLDLIEYLIPVYQSKHTVFDYWDGVDLSYTTGLPKTVTEELFGKDRGLKDILVQERNWDAVESTLEKAITTSKFNIYETFYDWILAGYKIYQIPKKIYDKNEERYIDYVQREFMISDRELRYKAELESICKNYGVEERKRFARCKVKVDRYDFVN